jgi:fumarate reductase flavoprotein subunit
MQASLANVIHGQGDNEDVHFEDTVRGSDWGADQHNVIFVGSNYLTQGELYRLGLLTTGFCLLAFLVLGTPWLLFVAR